MFIIFKVLLILFKLQSLISDNSFEPPPTTSSNNVIKLIIKTYVRDLLENPFIQEKELKQKLAKLNDHISTHPALHQRYLWVGSVPPSDYNPDHSIIEFDRNTSKVVVKKRLNSGTKREQLPPEEICETKEKWEQINDTHDLYENKVKVIQEKDMQQFVFTYRCSNNKGKCKGIADLFESECTERFGWMYMYYKLEDKPPQWGFVNAPHHCACKLKPKFFGSSITSSNDI